MKRLLFTLAGIISFAGLYAQCSVIEMPLVQRVNASSLIVEGKVTEQYSYWNSTHTMIYTANKIELYKIFKGSVATDAIEIITEGGTVDMDRITVEPNLELEVGQEGMFTCIALTRVKNNVTSRNALPQFEAYASLQGFVKYDPRTNTASDPFRRYTDIQTEVYNVCAPAGHHQFIEVKQRPEYSTNRQQQQFMAGPDPQSFSPSNLNAGTGDILEIFGEGFGASQGTGGVLFPNADDGGATFIEPLPSQYLVWQDDYIKLEVPQNAGTGIFEVRDGLGNQTGAPSNLTVFYAHLNVDFDPGSGTIAYQTDHVDDNGSGGYTWRMNTAFDADASARASFMRAFDTWRCATLVNWSIGATTSINDAVSDGTNIICFDNTAPLSANILGVCYSYWSGCASGPTIIWYVNELDIIFDEGSNIAPLTWEYGPAAPSGSEYDFETVAVHELGHGHQLGHIISPGSIMHYAISNGTSNRVLDGTDVAGGQFVQGKSVIANVCGPGAMSNTSCGSPPVADFNAISTTICAGTQAVFSDLSTGAPTQWLWTFTGGTPSSSTSQNPIITYNTPGVYDVSLTATNANGSDGETRIGYITVVANPTVGFTSNPGVLTVCEGDMVTLSGTGATSYNWNGPIAVTDGVPFACTQGGAYAVSGIDANGCFGSATATITMNSSPTITVTRTPSNGIVCSGGQATLAGNGAVSYAWTGGVQDNVAFTPPSTSSYTVTGTDGNGCTGTAVTSLTVQSCGTSTVPCGLTIQNKAQSASAVNVPGATQYRFTFYNNVTLAQVCQITQASRTLTFTSVPVIYGTTYRWTVAVNTGSGFGAESSINCTITFAVPSTTVPCGNNYNGFGGYTVASPRAGVSNYIFRFYNNVTMALVATRTQPSNYLYFNTVAGLQYGTTYRFTVQLEYPTGAGTALGPESSNTCTINFNGLSTTVPCNKTYSLSNVNSYTTAAPVSGASGYRFRFYQSSVLMGERVQPSNYIYFSQVTPALSAGVYQWTVEVLYNNGSGPVYGNPSTPCNVTFIGQAPMAPQNSWMERNAGDVTPEMPFSFAMSMYPNPLGDGVNPTVVINNANQRDAAITVMDLTGRVITTQMVYCEGDQYSVQLSDFPDLVAGMYIMQVQVGDQVQSQKFIAE
jgi:PKD repeat protein